MRSPETATGLSAVEAAELLHFCFGDVLAHLATQAAPAEASSSSQPNGSLLPPLCCMKRINIVLACMPAWLNDRQEEQLERSDAGASGAASSTAPGQAAAGTFDAAIQEVQVSRLNYISKSLIALPAQV